MDIMKALVATQDTLMGIVRTSTKTKEQQEGLEAIYAWLITYMCRDTVDFCKAALLGHLPGCPHVSHTHRFF